MNENVCFVRIAKDAANFSTRAKIDPSSSFILLLNLSFKCRKIFFYELLATEAYPWCIYNKDTVHFKDSFNGDKYI